MMSKASMATAHYATRRSAGQSPGLMKAWMRILGNCKNRRMPRSRRLSVERYGFCKEHHEVVPMRERGEQ